jgi:hypothetical protein
MTRFSFPKKRTDLRSEAFRCKKLDGFKNENIKKSHTQNGQNQSLVEIAESFI